MTGDAPERWGWRSDLPTFERTHPRVIALRLEQFVRDAGPEQVRAWNDSLPWLQRECRELVECHDDARRYTAILEYELPRDARRPDVIVLESGVVVVLELKGYADATQAGLDQVMAYARDLRAYHAACAARPVVPVLVPSRAGPEVRVRDDVRVVGPAGLHRLLESLARGSTAPPLTPEEFLRDDAYQPLPTIVQAAREIFRRHELRWIGMARAKTDPALRTIREVAHEAARTSTRHLVLLSGVPGSGKTLVGLQLVHAGWLDDLAVPRTGGRPTAPGVYLSGNGPLVAVLQDALREGGGGGRTFVQDIKKYVTHYSGKRNSVPPEHLLVFDEAQRAWDPERVARKHKRATIDESEPDHLIEFCERIPRWCVLVGLIGTGQAINQGEEAGLPLWRRAIERSSAPSGWTVHGAADCESQFVGGPFVTRWNPVLTLDTELRFHLAPRVHAFVERVLDLSDSNAAMGVAAGLDRLGFRTFATRSLDVAKEYVVERYAGAPESRFGIIASSRDLILKPYGIDVDYKTMQRVQIGRWFNAIPTDAASCCRLEQAASEFQTQGLELDFAILAWGSDLLRDRGAWSMKLSRRAVGTIHDPLGMRRNVYRVLLTRGRDGTVVFVPPDPRFDETWRYLLDCGFRNLDATP